MHTQTKLCKLWNEATENKERSLTIIKLTKELLNDFLMQIRLKAILEEKMEIMAMISLILDPTVSHEEKSRFLNGSRVSSPLVKMFKECFINNLKEQLGKIELIQIVQNVLNDIAKEKGILGGYLLPSTFVAKAVNETLAKGVKTISDNVGTKQDVVKDINNKNELLKKEQFLSKETHIVSKGVYKDEEKIKERNKHLDKKEIIQPKKIWTEEVNKQKTERAASYLEINQ